jgi:diguanylate cyclase (GGDEF)-like protein
MAPTTAQLIGGVRRLSAMAHSVRDDETVVRALRYELRTALDADEVLVEPRRDPAWPSLPLIVDARTRGWVVLITQPPRTLSVEEVEAASALIEAAAALLALLEARQAARVDSLTGALNHGAMLARLEEEIDRARRYGGGLGCLLLDLDSFKAINDTYGHATGDQVLRQVAMLLRAEFRAHDQVARYGGDEFVVVLPHAVGPRAEIAARRALRRIRDIHVVTDEATVPVRASIGVAEWTDPETPADLLAKADGALLAGKRGGKDQLRFAGDDPAHGGADAEGAEPVGNGV